MMIKILYILDIKHRKEEMNKYKDKRKNKWVRIKKREQIYTIRTDNKLN